jgi:RimJ/RimL family protein N-acetyltransferase
MVEANLAAPGFLPGVANVSYGLYPQARGYGYASRAVGLIMGYLKAETPADVVAIQVHPENLASKRLPVRLGFPFLGERVTEQGDRMLTYAMSIRGSRRLRLSNVCQS